MLTELPFNVSSEVERFLREVTGPPKRYPGFLCSPRYEMHREKEVLERFESEHYSIVWTSLESWHSVCAHEVLIAGRQFWITPEILSTLCGKTLSVIETDVGVSPHPSMMRRFIVAA
jgi:dihydropteroate synthase